MKYHHSQILILFFTVTISLCAINCAQEPTSQPEQYHSTPIPYSHTDSVEASRMALRLSGDLVAPRALRDTLLYKLYLLRDTFKDSISSDSSIIFDVLHRYITPWMVGELSVHFDDSTASKVRNGTYQGWSLIDSSLRPDAMPWQPDSIFPAIFTFNEEYNPEYLARIYARLPGVTSAEPNFLTFTLFPPVLYPRLINGELSCLFLLPAINEKNLYFKYIHGKPEFLGTWKFNMTPRPPWYDEAKKNYDSF